MLATTWFHVCYFVVVSFFLVRRFRLEFSKVSSMILFFFQAEDGIRDVAVTGVQTCALPISYAVFCLKKKTLPRRRAGRFEKPGEEHRRNPRPQAQVCARCAQKYARRRRRILVVCRQQMRPP